MKLNWPNAHYHLGQRDSVQSIFPKVLSIDLNEWEAIKQHLSANDYFSIGAHPWWVNQIDEVEIQRILIEGLSHPLNVGLGEIGLDGSVKHRASFHAQLKSLDFLLDILTRKKQISSVRTLIWHAVSAWEDVAQMIKKTPDNLIHIIHDYAGSAEWAKSMSSSHQCFFSLSPRLLKSSKRQLMIKNVDIKSILLESDDFSAKESEPLFTLSAQCLGLSADKWQEQVIENFFRAYPRIQHVHTT